jgi:hypothetical protein
MVQASYWCVCSYDWPKPASLYSGLKNRIATATAFPTVPRSPVAKESLWPEEHRIESPATVLSHEYGLYK